MIKLKDKKYFLLDEISNMFGVQKNTISSWRRKNKIQGVKINERTYVYSEDEILNLLSSSHTTDIIASNDEYTSNDVVKLLNITHATLSLWRKKGVIKFIKKSPRKIYYPKQEIDRIKNSKLNTSNMEYHIKNITNESNKKSIKKIDDIYEQKTFLQQWISQFKFKIPNYEQGTHNAFLNFTNVIETSSPISMINNNLEIVDCITNEILIPIDEIIDFIKSLEFNEYPQLDYSKTLKKGFEDFYVDRKK